MKLFLFNWIHPLQSRTIGPVPTEERPFMRAWSIAYPVLLYYVASTLFIMLFTYFMQWISGQDGMLGSFAEVLREYSAITSAVVNGLSMLVGITVILALFKRENLQIDMPKGHGRDILLLFIVGASTALCFNILFSLLQITASSENYAEVAKRQFSLPLWAGLILYGIVSPLAEEMVFRGLSYNGLYRHFSRPFAVIGSALVFGVYHGNAVQALYGFILGLFIAVLYERYGSFVVPVLLHSAANICVYVLSANTLWQEAVMNWGVCAASGAVTVLLSWYLLFTKRECNI